MLRDGDLPAELCHLLAVPANTSASQSVNLRNAVVTYSTLTYDLCQQKEQEIRSKWDACRLHSEKSYFELVIWMQYSA
jgi:hypothetical protein